MLFLTDSLMKTNILVLSYKIYTNQVDLSVEASIHFGFLSPNLWWSSDIFEVEISSQLGLKKERVQKRT
jgi:hypothetical protein